MKELLPGQIGAVPHDAREPPIVAIDGMSNAALAARVKAPPLTANLHVTDANASGAAIHPRLLVVAEPLAQVMLVEQYVGLGSVSYLTNAVAEIVVGNGARVDHYKVQNESTEAFHVGTAQVTQGRDSIYHSFSFAAGAALSRTNIYTKLADTNSEARLNGLSPGRLRAAQ